MNQPKATPIPLTRVTFSVSRHEEKAFREHAEQFFVDETPAQRAAEVQFQQNEKALDSLALLCSLALDENYTGAAAVRRFLLSLHLGDTYPLNLSTTQDMEEDIFEHCIAVLRLAYREKAPIFSYFDNGLEVFGRMSRFLAENCSG